MSTKVCSKCGVDKPLTSYCKCDSDRYGVYSICKECVNWGKRSEESRQKERERWLLLAMGFKICPRCSINKAVSEFRKQGSRKDGLRAYCIECENKLSKEHDQRPEIRQKRHERDKLPESKENRRQYRQNSDKFKATQIKYENTPKRKEWRLNYGRIKMVKIGRNLRNHVWRFIKQSGGKPIAKFDTTLGCTLEYFIKYIESKWEIGMSWDNYGHKGWHLDHIKPMAYFDLNDTKQFLECGHYTNYQPLWAKENFTKNSYLNGERQFFKKQNYGS